MGGFNGGNGKNSGRNRKNTNRSSFKNRLFIERNVESLEDRQMLDGSGVLSNFGDYYLYQGQKQSILRSGTELVVQFESGKRDISEFQLLFPGGLLMGFTKATNLGEDAAVYRRDANPNQSSADQVLSLMQIASQVKQSQGVLGAGPAFSGKSPGSELYILNEMYVGLKPGVSADTFFKSLPDVSSWKKIRGSANDYVVGLKVNLGIETLSYAANLASNPSVVYSEPNSWAKISKAALPNDPYLGLEWQIQNTGQGGGTAGADINAVTAWNRGVTGTGVVIAVIDDGVQLTHPDLVNNISINTNEIPNDGIDNDNNGYIDDDKGWDFADNDNDPNPRLVDDAHGTAVAGLAAGVGNNAIGVAGVAYTSKILPIRVPFNGEPTTATAFIEAVYYAAGLDNGGNRVWRGADVLNASYGSGSPRNAEAAAWLAAFQNGRGGLGALNFASTGNSGQANVSFPAAYPGVIAVGASDYNDLRSTYSQYGPEIDIVAPSGPGSKPYELSPSAYPLTTDLVGAAGYNSDLGGLPEYPTSQVTLDYSTFSGTSASSPIAAGGGALAVAANPKATATEITSAITSTAAKVGGVTYDNNGFNIEYGYGRMNIGAAVAKLQSFQVTTTTPLNGATVNTAPTQVIIYFSEPVNFASISASDLKFTNVPQGVTITVGTPSLYNALPNAVAFPIKFSAPITTRVSGTFGYNIAADSIISASGKFIAAYSGNFNYNDVSGPRVTSVTVESRKINATFNEILRDNSLSLKSVQLYRSNGTVNPLDTLVTKLGDPRVAIAYDPLTSKLTLDLTNLPQSLLPSDTYTLILRDTITDVAGNSLDGEYNGTLPSGDGTQGTDFVYGLGYRAVKAPKFVYSSLAPYSDSGNLNDQNTSDVTPDFVGQVQSDFPAAVQGVTVVAQYNALQPGGVFDLDLGPGGRGWSGNPQVITTTDGTGKFTIAYGNLPALQDGYYKMRLVAVGQPTDNVLPGLSTKFDQSFRVDTTHPYVNVSNIQDNSFVAALPQITLDVIDPIRPVDTNSPFAVPILFDVSALNVNSATNISNYSFINVGADGIYGTSDDRDSSAYITGVTYTNTTNRVTTADPYSAQVAIKFSSAVPAGKYVFTATSRVTDSAANTLVPYSVSINVNPTPVYITGFQMGNTTTDGSSIDVFVPTGGPRSIFELPNVNPSVPQAAETSPDTFVIDFSNTLDASTISNNSVQLFRSADSNIANPDGDFRYFGTASDPGNGYVRVTGVSVSLIDSIPGCAIGSPGYRNRLLVKIPAGTQLVADNYRIQLPNSGSLAIRDIFGLQLDGEFLGNPAATAASASVDEFGKYLNPVETYQTLMPTGKYRNGLSGDAVAGGTFITGFTVVPNGNLIFARADYNDDPFILGDDPDGSFAKPFPTLVAEAVASLVNGGDLNSPKNYGINFNPAYDRNGNGHFDPSAFYAAGVKSANGPVAIIALASSDQYNPVTGKVERRTFVIQTPQGTTNEGSGSVPAMTTLVFDTGSALKMMNTNIYVQTQGSAIQTRGGSQPGQSVIFTSYADDSVGSDANGDGIDTAPSAADWGGLILRNFDDVSNGRSQNPVLFPINGALGLSGADDVMSAFNYADIRYAGGPVPQTIGNRYNAITLFNARPMIANTRISSGGGSGSAQAAIAADFDSFREDAIARGPLVRQTSLVGNSINGIWLMSNANGYAEPTNAMFYPDNPSFAGGAQNYTFDDPLPYVPTSQVVIGERLNYTGGVGTTQTFTNRMYVQPGMMFKMQKGAWFSVQTPKASINIGDRTYIYQYDANPNFGPQNPTFQPNTTGDAKVLFTSIYDDTASTFYFDPATGTRTTIVPQIDTDNAGSYLQPTPALVSPQARWGAFNIVSGVVTVVDEAQFQYGGGLLNYFDGTFPSLNVLNFDASATATGTTAAQFGAYASITNNDFLFNIDAPVAVRPNSLYAGDPTRPLSSGNPYFRGNVMQGNGIDGLAVLASVAYNPNGPVEQPVTGAGTGNYFNLSVDSVWDDTDITYVVRGTIIMAGWSGFGGVSKPAPDPTVLTQELKPKQTLTFQSSLPDTLLADGSRIARPGESLLVKLLNDPTGPQAGGAGGGPDGQGNDLNETFAGAGFVVGRDNGIDPTPDSTLDAGWGSQIRILGIGSNETTGQSRVPVVFTSLRDGTYGKTVRGVPMNNILSSTRYAGLAPTSPAPGDGGVLYFGSLSLTDYNLFDPRGGNLVDNADLRYLTRLEMQGGNVADMVELDGQAGITIADNPLYQKLGLLLPGTNSPALTQYNSANAMTLSNSNFANFRDVGMVVHPGNDLLARVVNSQGTGGFVQRVAGLKGQGNVLFAVNNTFANMQAGINALSETTDNVTAQNPTTIMALNNTFYNTDYGMFGQAPGFNGQNSNSHVYMYVMDNIFANNSQAAIVMVGQNYGSEAQYNLYFNNGFNASGIYDVSGIIGDPVFRDTSKFDFTLLPGSAAIDVARSEVGPLAIGNALAPISDQVLAGTVGGIRNQTGRISSRGGAGVYFSSDIVTLPGYPYRNYKDQFIPILPGTPVSYAGTASNVATWDYTPISGERDQNGYLRQDDPSSGNLGFGSRPFFDVGAFEYRKLVGPHVTAVTALLPGNTTPINIYQPLGVAGTNQSPDSISFLLDSRLDPLTVNSSTIILMASGGDGIFGNNNSTSDRSIDLSGKLTYDALTKTITVNLATSNLYLTNDLYRIILVGEGASVIRDQRGNPLDGENLDTRGQQLPLPSGNTFPGGSFQVTFSVDTNPPKVLAGSFRLDPASDTGQPGDQITRATTPQFTGTVVDIPPPANPLINQTVNLSVSTLGNGIYDLPNVGTATTDAQGIFVVRPSQPLPDTNYNVGPDGILGTPDDSGYSVARVSVTDTSGNISNPNDRNAQLKFVVDSQGPRVTSASPSPSSQISPGSILPITLGMNENVNPASLNNQTIQVVRSGGDGVFGNGNDVSMTIDAASISITYLKVDAQGSVNVAFNVNGPFPNDLYRVTLVGAGTNTVTDRAGNPLNGQFNGSFPSGVTNGTGSNYVMYYTILDPSRYFVRYVSPSGNDTTATGSITSPYGTIQGAINAAQIGDTVAVMAGTYNENVVLKSLIQVVSAGANSTNTTLYPGDAKATIIRPAANATNVITVSASGLISTPVAPTRLSGFTIASNLVGNPVTGSIEPTSVGLAVNNSSIAVDRIYAISSGTGIQITTSGNSAPTPVISNTVVVGNNTGIGISDSGNTESLLTPIVITNNTIGFNNNGVMVNVAAGSPVDFVQIINSILSGNASVPTSSSPRSGYAVSSTTVDRVTLRFNNFFNNGVSATNYADDTNNIGNGFDPAALNTGRDSLGNVPGDPAFVFPVDPRPNADGPLRFFIDGNYNIRIQSAAIDAADNAAAPLLDFLYRTRVTIPGRGYPGTGPADMGAFEYNGASTNPSWPVVVPTSGSGGSSSSNNPGGTTGGGTGGSTTGGTTTNNPGTTTNPIPQPAPRPVPKPVAKPAPKKPVVRKPIPRPPVGRKPLVKVPPRTLVRR